MQQIEDLEREKSKLSFFDFKGRRELKRHIKELEKQVDDAFRSLEIININLI